MYFASKGQPDTSVLYHVDRIRDGKSFSTRMVKSTQRGQTILSMMVSYHKHEEQQAMHQYAMPQVPGPDELKSYDELLLEAIA